MSVPPQRLGVTPLSVVTVQLGMAALVVLLIARPGWAAETLPRSAAPKGAAVYFISPTEGAIVKSPVTVRSPGGTLHIEVSDGFDLIMKGPVAEVATGRLSPAFAETLR